MSEELVGTVTHYFARPQVGCDTRANPLQPDVHVRLMLYDGSNRLATSPAVGIWPPLGTPHRR